MKEILETYKLPELKKMIRSTNITGYSKLKKDELIKLMIRPEHIARFKSIKPKSARVAPVPEGSDKPKMKVLRELKKKFPAYKEYIEFYQKSGFTKPKDLPAPPKWLLEGKEPPSNFKIPKKIKFKVIEEAKQPKPIAKQPKQPKQPKKSLPSEIKNNKELFDLLKDRPIKIAISVYTLANDLIDRLEDDSAKTQINARIELAEEDEELQEIVSIIDPQLFYKSITEGDDKTGKKAIFIKEREKRLEKEKRDDAKKKKDSKK